MRFEINFTLRALCCHKNNELINCDIIC